MNLKQYINAKPESKFEDAKAYTTYILDNADRLREYLMLKQKWGKVMKHTTNFDDPLFDAASGLLHKVDKEQPISFSPHTKNGQIHNAMLESFVSADDITLVEKNEIIALATNKPFSEISAEEFSNAKAILTIQKQECVYSNDANYEVVTANNGLDISITTDVDCAFVAYLMVCSDTDNQNEIANYSPVGGDNPITTPVSSTGGKLTISLSARKVRTYNKVFIKPSKPCIFTATTKLNRG